MTAQPSQAKKKSLCSLMYESANTRWFLSSLFVLGITLWVLRKSDPLFMIQPFAEDGSVFLHDVVSNPWLTLFSSNVDYLMVIPHLVAFFSLKLLGLSNAPVGMYFAGIVIGVLCAVFFATKQFRFVIKNDLLRAVCSLFIIVAPVTQVYDYSISTIEYFLNVFLLLFTLLLLFNYEDYKSKSNKKKYLYAFFCSMSFLSSAYSVIFLPPLVYVAIREIRRIRNDLSTILSYTIPIIPLLFQIGTIYLDHFVIPFRGTASIGTSTIGAFLALFVGGISKIFYSPNMDILHDSGKWLFYSIGAILLAFVLLNSLKKRSGIDWYVLACIVIIPFVTSMGRHLSVSDTLFAGQVAGYERYFFTTMVFSFILIMRQFDKKQSKIFGLICLGLVIIVGVNVAHGFTISPFPDVNYSNMSKVYNPTGKFTCIVNVAPYPYYMVVPCLKPTSIHGTTVDLTSNSMSTIRGAVVSFTATVSPTPNGGVMQLNIDGMSVGNPAPLVGGQATFNTSELPVGMHKLFASYSGAPNFYPSASDPIKITVLSLSDLKNADLSGANLQGIDLSRANLQGSNLSDANLQGSNLSDANLQGANLSGALLLGANLDKVNLQGSNLSSANLQNTNLMNADLQNAILSGSILRGANTTGANFAGATTNGCNGCP